MTQVEVMAERETGHGWTFDLQMLDEAGMLTRHRLALSWADYNLWSVTGADEPQHVAAAVLRFLASRLPAAAMPRTFDAAVARRLVPGADEGIAALIQAS